MSKDTQADIVMEYFTNHPQKDIPHPEVVDWAVQQYEKRTGKKFRDPDRQIRKFHQEGLLIKVKKGVYRYDPDLVKIRELEDFSESQKQAILQRDNYRCVICGKGKNEGIELHVDHIKPKDNGGRATIENGQTLCSVHNFRKKNYQQTETGKKMFIRLYDLAQSIEDRETMNFCEEILEVFEKNNINGHIEWKK
ncbi:MAG: HNH endonuclease [Cyanobacterium sp. T60_A2020_053]|nr:HNH endonuclease [Cyanobacterium sp. T60_A2020_053]